MSTAAPTKTRTHVVCRVSELPPGERRIVEIGKRSIGVFNIAGEFYAIRNLCPHQLAPLCKGKVTGYCAPSPVGEYHWGREGEIVRCPWHGWEFDIRTGQSIFNPHRVKTGTFRVSVEPGGSRAAPGTRTIGEGEKDPAVESYAVEVHDGLVILHV
jgi:nitrite reductase/ring-hydroxylating ferredoxin subunit